MPQPNFRHNNFLLATLQVLNPDCKGRTDLEAGSVISLFLVLLVIKESQDKYHAVINGNTSCTSKNFPEASYQIRCKETKVRYAFIHWRVLFHSFNFFMLLGKVKLFWESHKIWKKNHPLVLTLLSHCQNKSEVCTLNCLAFLENINFT